MSTKGKWESEGIQPEVRGIIIRGDDGGIIARVATMGGTAKEAEANANLIAASPKLYEGLRDALREICRMCVRINPQHKNCTSCEEMERSRLPLREAEGNHA